MCGIAGIFHLDGAKADRRILHRLDTSLSHRGPDGHGELIFDNIALANRRLAIIDPTPAGRQPMQTPDRRLSIVFNGEIFNYRKIRQDLVKKGIRFRTGSDTEVLLEGYRVWGENIVRRLIGQFAFAVFDKAEGKLFLARDPLGVNPLYYACVNNTFLFASEVKALLESPLIKKELDPASLHHYLSFFMIPAPLTIIKDIKSLMPGSTLTVTDGEIKIRRYYLLPHLKKIKYINDPEIVKHKLRQQLITAVASTSVADVPVGAFLSGGIDSSTVVAILSSMSKNPVRTYSLYTEDESENYDERKYARLVSARYKTNHTEITVSGKDIIRELPKIIRAFDQPTGGAMETYFIAASASRDVKVALSGLGGDELFAGYHGLVYRFKILSSLYRHIPKRLRSSFTSFLMDLLHSPDIKKSIHLADKFLSLETDVKKRLFLYFAYSEEEKRLLYSDEYLAYCASFSTDLYVDSLLQPVKNLSIIDQLSYFDLSTYTRDDLLLGTNMTSMAHGLEVRLPLLDIRLLDLAARIPPKLKYSRHVSKYIFRQVASQWLPKEVITHKKTGLGLPRVKFMKGVLKPYILEALNPSSVKKRGIFAPHQVADHIRQFYSDRSGKMLWREHLRLWILFILELWCREFLD